MVWTRRRNAGYAGEVFFILPLGHERTTVRHFPWMTAVIGILCVVLQLRACQVEGELQEQYLLVAQRMAEVEDEALRDYERKAASDRKDKPLARDAERLIEAFARDRAQFMLENRERLSDFRAGRLTGKDDALYKEYLQLQQQKQEIEESLPSIQLGYRPASDGLLSMISSLFAHGGWIHLLSNLWFLYLVGCNLEDRWGRAYFTAFYLLGGVVGCVTYGATHPDSMIPIIGASGAVAAAMGAFLVCFGSTTIRFGYLLWVFLLVRVGTFQARALIMLPLWLLTEMIMFSVEASGATAVAHSAHVGGFIYGLGVAGALRFLGLDKKLDEAQEHAVEEWAENPLYLRAVDRARQGHHDEALAMITDVLWEQPDHPEAKMLQVEVALKAGRPEMLDGSLGWYMEEKHREGDHGALLSAFLAVEERLPQVVLTDRQLSQVIHAGKELRKHRPIVPAVRRMMEHHATSPMLPRAMWEAAEAQRRLGRTDLSKKTLESIVQRFPSDPFAEKARELLATGAQ